MPKLERISRLRLHYTYRVMIARPAAGERSSRNVTVENGAVFPSLTCTTKSGLGEPCERVRCRGQPQPHAGAWRVVEVQVRWLGGLTFDDAATLYGRGRIRMLAERLLPYNTRSRFHLIYINNASYTTASGARDGQAPAGILIHLPTRPVCRCPMTDIRMLSRKQTSESSLLPGQLSEHGYPRC